MINAIEKELSRNDTGETGGHMAGILIPKNPEVLGFFPALPSNIKNPRAVIDFTDEAGKTWSFNFIYYNNRFFGGTRNEYRLTGMTAFIRDFNLKTGDVVVMERLSERYARIRYKRQRSASEDKVIKLGVSGWRVVDFADES